MTMKTNSILLIILFIICSEAISQQHFIPHDVTYGSHTGQISLADIDGDSDLDMVAFYNNDKLLAWYNNDGTGYFDSLIVISKRDSNLYGGYPADLDNDGNIDIVIGGYNDVIWYKNLGAGIFGPEQTITNNVDIVTSVFASDLDNDSLIDVISASYGDSILAWYKNLGNGNFGPQQIISTNVTWSYTIFANDIDVDGNSDILYSSYDANKVAWHKNLSAGVFGSEQIITNNAVGAYGLMTADLDNNNLPDIITSHAGGTNNKITWHKNLGGGNFSPETIINNTLEIPRYFYPADFDMDGDLDIVLTSWNEDSLVWKENLGGGNFGPNQLISATLDGPNSVYAGDLNGDGSMDIVAGGTESSSIEVYINHGTGLFDLNQTISNATADVMCVYADDLDNDGQIDILSASHTDNKIAWYKNLGNKEFSLQKVISSTRTEARSVVAADLDNDGFKDVISAAYGDTLAWHKNLENGNFSEPQKIPDASNTKIVKIGDIDNDGLLDIVFFKNQINNIYMVKNLGNGSFGPMQFLYHLVGTLTLDIDDVNNDSYPDIVFGSGSTVSVGMNDGTGGFLAVQNLNIANGAVSLCLEDMDNDGFTDIVYTGNIGSLRVVKWYPNDGLGNFTNSILVSELPYYSYTICTTDIDNDNDPDIVTATGGGNTSNGVVYWFENLGAGSFAPAQSIDSLGGDMVCIFPSDLDNDGDHDLTIALQGLSMVKWLENPLNNLVDTIIICANDSAIIFGNWVSQPGDYTDTLTNALGGDSINIIRLENYQSYFPVDTVEICQGESYEFHGQVLDTAGAYSATLQSVHGCDSIVELPLVVIPAPAVSISPFTPDSVSIDTSLIALPLAIPAGGIYSGTGVTAPVFDPALAGLGEFWISYTFTDTITGCSGQDSTLIKVYNPIGIEELENPEVKLYPNPGTGNFVLTGTNLQSVHVRTFTGKLVKKARIKNRSEVHFNLLGQAKGIYFVHIINDDEQLRRLLILM